MVQRSSGAAAIGYLQKKQFATQCCFVKLEKRKAAWAEGPQTAFLLLQACWLAGEEHQRPIRGNQSADESFIRWPRWQSRQAKTVRGRQGLARPTRHRHTGA